MTNRVSPKARQKECNCEGVNGELMEMQVARRSDDDFGGPVREGLWAKRDFGQWLYLWKSLVLVGTGRGRCCVVQAKSVRKVAGWWLTIAGDARGCFHDEHLKEMVKYIPLMEG